jgi:hypothetical protein
LSLTFLMGARLTGTQRRIHSPGFALTQLSALTRGFGHVGSNLGEGETLGAGQPRTATKKSP